MHVYVCSYFCIRYHIILVSYMLISLCVEGICTVKQSEIRAVGGFHYTSHTCNEVALRLTVNTQETNCGCGPSQQLWAVPMEESQRIQYTSSYHYCFHANTNTINVLSSFWLATLIIYLFFDTWRQTKLKLNADIWYLLVKLTWWACKQLPVHTFCWHRAQLRKRWTLLLVLACSPPNPEKNISL